MPKFHCYSSEDVCQRAISEIADELGFLPVASNQWANQSWLASWAVWEISTESIDFDRTNISFHVKAKLATRIIIQIVLFLTCSCVALLVNYIHLANLTAILLMIPLLVFLVYLLLAESKKNQLLNIFVKHIQERDISLEQVSPPIPWVKNIEIMIWGCWLSIVIIGIYTGLGLAAGMLTTAIVLWLLLTLLLLQNIGKNFQISLHFTEWHIIYSMIMLSLPIVFVAMYSLVVSASLYLPTDGSTSIESVTSHLILTEPNRPTMIGVSRNEYINNLSNSILNDRRTMGLSRICVVCCIFFIVIGFWSLRRNRQNILNLIYGTKPCDINKPITTCETPCSRYDMTMLIAGCLLAGAYRWLYVIIAVDVTASIWLKTSIIFDAMPWIVHSFLNSLLSLSQFPVLWWILGLVCIQISVIPGLLLVIRTTAHLATLIHRGIRLRKLSRISPWNAPLANTLRESLSRQYPDITFDFIEVESVKQIAEAEYIPFIGCYIIKIDAAMCAKLQDDQIKALLLHEFHHVLHNARLSAWLKIGSLLLLSPCYSLYVLHNFYDAEYQADLFACRYLNDSESMCSAIYQSKAEYAKRQASLMAKSKSKSPFDIFVLLRYLSWLSPIFIYNVIWTAAYPTELQRQDYVERHHTNGLNE